MYLQNIGSGVTIQDLIAVGESTIYFSALKIKSEKSSFLAYWKLAANRHMIEYIKKNSYTSNAKMFAGVSLDEENKNIEDGLTFANIIGVEDKNHIDIHGIIDIVDGSDTFTSEERKTIHLFLFGYNFKEISQITHTSLSNVYVRYNSCVNKIREIIGK